MTDEPIETSSALSPHATEVPYQPFSVGRIVAIANNTLVELTRQKVFYTLIVFALFIISTASFFSQFGFEREDVGAAQIQFVKDFGLGAIAILGCVLAIVGTAQLLPAEVENRTLYSILAKPVSRLEFILGKYLGVLMLLAISVAIMGLLFFVVLVFKGERVIQETAARSMEGHLAQGVINETTQRLHNAVYDPQLFKVFFLLTLKMALLSAFALFFSTFSTSMIFTVVVSACVYFIGHLEFTAKEVAKSEGTNGFFSNLFMMVVTVLVPNLKSFTLADDVVQGIFVPWGHFWVVTGYGFLYIFFLILFSHLVFSEKEI